MTANAGMTGCQADYWVETKPADLRWNCYWSGSCGTGFPRYPSPVAAMKTLLNGNAEQLDVYWLWDLPGTGRMVWESDPSAGQRTCRAYERRSAGPIL